MPLGWMSVKDVNIVGMMWLETAYARWTHAAVLTIQLNDVCCSLVLMA